MKNVIITGAAGNLGKVCVSRFAAEGYNVIALVSPGKAHFPFHGQGVTTFQADLTDEGAASQAVASIVARYKTIDAALLLAGGFSMGSVNDTNGESLKRMFALNFETAYHIARPVFQHMVSQAHGGRIIMVGAKPALVAADGRNKLAYTLSKSLLFKLAEILNAEGSAKQVTTSIIVPGTIDTSDNRKSMPDADFGTWVNPQDLADAMLYLCSDKSQALREPVLKMYGGQKLALSSGED